MKAIFLDKAETLRVAQRLIPAPGPDEVLLRVRACGICGPDVHYYLDGRCSDKVVTQPHILGHEFSGVIEAVGPETEAPPEGTLVAVQPAMSCRHCDFCRLGRPNLCRHIRFAGSFPVEGAYQEHFVCRADLAFPVPADLGPAEAALVEPLACAVHAAELGRVKFGDRVAILGCGPIGLMTAVACQAHGADVVAMTEPVDARREMGRRLGVPLVLDPAEDSVDAELTALAADVVFDCAADVDTLDQALSAVAAGGRVVVVGFSQEPVMITPIRAIRKEVELRFMLRFVEDFPAAIQLMARRRQDLGRLITHRVPFEAEAIARAYQVIADKADGVVKTTIEYE